MLLLTILLALNPITLMEVADVNASYPDIDIGLGINYPLLMFENFGYARAGLYGAWDMNTDLGKPDWGSVGAFVSREIQVNITIGGMAGYRFGEPEGLQLGLFLGFDLFPWEYIVRR